MSQFQAISPLLEAFQSDVCLSEAIYRLGFCYSINVNSLTWEGFPPNKTDYSVEDVPTEDPLGEFIYYIFFTLFKKWFNYYI